VDADGVGGRRDPSADRQTKIVMEADSDVRLDLLVAARAGLSRTAAATLIANGHVTVDGRRERASYKPRAGECLTIAPPPARERAVEPEAIPLQVVFEDDDVLVVDKPAGMVVHPAPGNWRGTLVNALLGRAIPLSAIGGAERAGLVHRLDKETSGLVLVAKTERAHRVLGAALAARRIDRRYAALCWGHLSDDVVTVDRPVARDPRNRQRMAIVASGKTARTTLVRLARFDSVDLLHAQLHTGRTHQIRVHLAHLGHPVVGDDVYGGGGGRRLLRLLARRHFLHAAWLRFRHPITNSLIDLRSPLPIDLREVVSVVAEQVVPDPLMAYAFFDHPLVPRSSVEN
jgi:23S rRNA pseudouridine1911/1915/1917 synthase